MSLDKVKNIVLVLSGKGGVGKSSVTTQLALALTLRGHSVGILDVDLTGPSMPRFLNIETSRITQAPGGWLPVQVHASQAFSAAFEPPASASDDTTKSSASVPSTAGPLYAMSLGLLLASRNASIVWRGPKKTAMVRQFLTDVLWPELDYLLIDTPPGTSDEHISLAETLLHSVADAANDPTKQTPNVAGAVVVTTPQAVAVSDVRKELNFCAKTGIPVIGVVENMSGYVCPCCGEATNVFSSGGGKLMAEDFAVPFLGAIPIDGLWGELVEEGRRPVYKEVATPDVEGQDDAEWEAEVREKEMAQEPGLLVDKYRSCSLWRIFDNIARDITEKIQSGTAVAVADGL